MISACDVCGELRDLDGDWRCEGCRRDTEPCPPPVHPPELHAAVLRYDVEDWEGAGRAEYEIAMQEMSER